MSINARILKNDPPEYGIKLLVKIEGEGQYRKTWFPSETELNAALCETIASASSEDRIRFTTAGLRSNGKEYAVPGNSEEWVRLFQQRDCAPSVSQD